MEVRWSEEAYRDLERIYARIAAENPSAAREVVLAVFEGCAKLREFPELGRSSRISGRRELIFPPLPYIVVYKLKSEAVEISRIYHAAQDWP